MEKKHLIDYLPIAEQDITEIIEYISNDDPSSEIGDVVEIRRVFYCKRKYDFLL